jgi:hypothetical protein
MSHEETEIMDFLRSYGKLFVSVIEVSRRLGARGGRFMRDKSWARPLMLRLEVEGLIESNQFGEFRLKQGVVDTDFLSALDQADPGLSLGDTTIIRLKDYG